MTQTKILTEATKRGLTQTVGSLIKELQQLDQDLEIGVLDGFNGGGIPRALNMGPYEFNPSDEDQTFDGHGMADYSDLKTEEGQKIVYIGYGCY